MALDIAAVDALHDVLDRYEGGDVGGILQVGGWADIPAPDALPLASLGGCEPRFSLAGNAYAEQASDLLNSLSSGNAYAEQASELLNSLSSARLPGNMPAALSPSDLRPLPRGGRHSLDDAGALGGADRWLGAAPRFSDASSKDEPEGDGDGDRSRYIGAYSPAARKRRIAAFHSKRERRVWTRKVKYDVRKNFADTRMRVKGRFVKKEDEDMLKELIAIT